MIDEESESAAERLKKLQALPFERKILKTQARIIEWYQYYDGRVYVSFSGGKDSTVLLHIARRLFPDIKAVFVNTGLEYPEIRKFALSHDNVTELHPTWGRAGAKYGKGRDDTFTFIDTLKIYGYPLISKSVSNALNEARRTMAGSRWQRLNGEYRLRDGGRSQYDFSKYLPLFDLPVKISDDCCRVMKKGPAHKFQRKEKLQPILGTMAEESLIRKQAWITRGGCNGFKAKTPTSNPLSFWNNQDILRYILRYNIEICSVYGQIVTIGTDGLQYPPWMAEPAGLPLACSGCNRTGCIFCAFGLHMERGETRFQRLAVTHPRQYEFCMTGGEWADNENYDPTITGKKSWNPKKLWVPNKKGLGMRKVFEMVNEIYGKGFLRYE